MDVLVSTGEGKVSQTPVQTTGSRPCLLPGAKLVPVSARHCQVTGALHGTRVSRSWTPTCKDMKLV